MGMTVFEFLKSCVSTQESKVLFVLMIIAVAMIIDFITGTIAAYVNPEIQFKSKAGINGILRKIASMLLLIVFLPVSVLIPGNVGIVLVYTLYFGYLIMEVKSIIENVGKNGTDTSLFTHLINKISDNTNE
ncbi:phage holin family protein [Peptostreptococcus stomatis]|uniref:phage holin family protein n=1 Tax=Peptostreptococcus stomatis TaxID=341694 RepID=UPI003F9F4160